jgi:Tol biopolymer transport system component
MVFFRNVDGVHSLWIADDRGGALRELSTAGLVDISNEDFSEVEWSPDGTSILLMTSVAGIPAPAIVPTDGSAAHVIALDTPAENPVWLPGGEILFRGTAASGFGLFAIRPDGTGIRTIVPATGANEWDALFFNVSPDGSQIAYQWREGNATQKIYVVPATGGTPRAITSVESAGVYWSPDSRWIAVLGDDGTYVVPADGSAPERRVISAAPGGASIRWTPDGSRLLVVVSGQSDQLLFNPRGGAGELAPWSSTELPDWQRLAPTP